MAFTITKESVKRAQKCPVGMHLATIVEVEDTYFNDNGTEIQKVTFDTDSGYSVSKWFNDKFISDIIELVEAADKVKFDMANMKDTPINLKEYLGRKIAISVSHTKDKNNKIQANIDNFFSPDKVPF